MRMLVDGDDTPGRAFGSAAQMIEARDGAGVDREAKDPFRFGPRRHGERDLM